MAVTLQGIPKSLLELREKVRAEEALHPPVRYVAPSVDPAVGTWFAEMSASGALQAALNIVGSEDPELKTL